MVVGRWGSKQLWALGIVVGLWDFTEEYYHEYFVFQYWLR